MNDDKKREKNKTVVNEHFWFTAITLGINAFIIKRIQDDNEQSWAILTLVLLINLYAIFLILHRAAAHAGKIEKPNDIKEKPESQKNKLDKWREGIANLKAAVKIIPRVFISFGSAMFYLLLVVSSFIGIILQGNYFFINQETIFLSNISQAYFNKFIIPSLSVTIGGLAVIVSTLILRENRKRNMLSLRPLLIFRADINLTEGKVRLYIANQGMGPCIFGDFYAYYCNEQFWEMSDLFDRIKDNLGYGKDGDDFNREYQTFAFHIERYVLAPQQEKPLLKFQLNKDNPREGARELYKEIEDIPFYFSYFDLYKKQVSKKPIEYYTFSDLHSEKPEKNVNYGTKY